MVDQSNRGSTSATRDRILEIAERLFHERGYGATGVATVLRAAGVRSGSLYHFFRGKEALLLGVLERHLSQLRIRVFEPVERTTADPLERVFVLLDLYRRNLEMTGFTRGCPVGNLALEVSDTIPAARDPIDRYFASWTREVHRWLEAAGDRLPGDLPREALARLVLAVMEGGVMQARAHHGIEPYDAAVGQFKYHMSCMEDRARFERGEGQASGSRESRQRDRSGRGPNGSAWRTW